MWSSYVVPMWSLSVLYLSLENFFLVQFTTGFYYFFTFVFWIPRRDFMSFFVKNSKKSFLFVSENFAHIFFQCFFEVCNSGDLGLFFRSPTFWCFGIHFNIDVILTLFSHFPNFFTPTFFFNPTSFVSLFFIPLFFHPHFFFTPTFFTTTFCTRFFFTIPPFYTPIFVTPASFLAHFF